jgi:hypothetical protein
VDKTMANRNLLKEAIADAKSVKEAAIANAKAALEEAFTPYLKEKFSAKLAEMEAEDMDEAKEEMDENYSEEGMEEMSNPVMRRGLKGDDKEEKRTEKMREESEMEEMDLDELLAELDEEMGKDKDMEENLNEDARTDAEEEGYEDGMEDEKEDEEDDEIDLEDMTEDELKDLIEDVIEDMVRAGELEAGEKFEDDEEEDIDIDIEDEEEITEMKKQGYDDREDESVSARRGKEADKKQSFKARRDDSYGKFGKRDAEATGKASGPGKNKINKENLNEEEDMMDEGVIDQLKAVYNDPEVLGKLITVDGKKMSLKDFLKMAGTAAAGGMRKSGAGKGPFNTEGVEEDKRTDAEEEGYLDGMRDEKEDMMREIEELASTLSETKLLNAKLLYTNKIFRAKNLNETQKVKVLEAFDKATSVRDAKLIYETLTTVKETKTAVTESMRGMASKAAGMAPEKKPILEVNDQFARWQILAGIKRN